MDKGIILIVDDNPFLGKSVKFSLTIAGAKNVFTYTSIFDVEPSILKKANLLFLDIEMPDQNGITSLSQIVDKYPKLPVIMLTGTNELSTAVECMKRGAVDYLVKPATETELIKKTFEHITTSVDIDIITIQELLSTVDNIKTTLQNTDDPLGGKIYEILWGQQLFTDPDMTITKLSTLITSNQKSISSYINSTCDMNFRSLLRRIRITAFIQEMNLNQTLSQEGVAKNVGFRRYGTLCEACNSILGLQPRQLGIITATGSEIGI